MGSKSVRTPADQTAHVHAPRIRSGITPRRWHPVVYLATGPVRFAGRDTIADAMDEARSLAESLGAATFSVQPGRWSVLVAGPSSEGGVR